MKFHECYLINHKSDKYFSSVTNVGIFQNDCHVICILSIHSIWRKIYGTKFSAQIYAPDVSQQLINYICLLRYIFIISKQTK